MSSVHSNPTPHCTDVLVNSELPKSRGAFKVFFSRYRSGRHQNKMYIFDLWEHRKISNHFVFRVETVFLTVWLDVLENSEITEFHRTAFISAERNERGSPRVEYSCRGCFMDVLSKKNSPIASPTSQLRAHVLDNSPFIFENKKWENEIRMARDGKLVGP